MTYQQTQQQAAALAQGLYPASKIPVPPPPFPLSGGTALVLGSIQNGTLVPLFGPNLPTLQPIVLPIHESPPSSIFPFNFAPGETAVQIQPTSWPCRKIVFYAPTTNTGNIYMGMVGISPTSIKIFPIAPGQPGTVDISDINLIYWVATNTTDVISGWAESNL
jgi:hypothetical protein